MLGASKIVDTSVNTDATEESAGLVSQCHPDDSSFSFTSLKIVTSQNAASTVQLCLEIFEDDRECRANASHTIKPSDKVVPDVRTDKTKSFRVVYCNGVK
jgi:hypothetical protein